MHLAQLAWTDRAHERLLLRAARHRQDAPGDRAWRSRPARPGTASRSRPPSNGSTASRHAQHRNALDDELKRLERYSLLVVDEIGYLPLERQAANLLFALVARRYERGSIIVTSNRGFEAWGEILGDAMVAAALIDRLVHHAHIITLKGKSYRLTRAGHRGARRGGDPARRPTADDLNPRRDRPTRLAHYSLPESGALFGSC